MSDTLPSVQTAESPPPSTDTRRPQLSARQEKVMGLYTTRLGLHPAAATLLAAGGIASTADFGIFTTFIDAIGVATIQYTMTDDSLKASLGKGVLAGIATLVPGPIVEIGFAAYAYNQHRKQNQELQPAAVAAKKGRPRT